MGRALASAFLTDGHPLTVWNRTPGRAGDLPGWGATVASSAEDAVRTGEPDRSYAPWTTTPYGPCLAAVLYSGARGAAPRTPSPRLRGGRRPRGAGTVRRRDQRLPVRDDPPVGRAAADRPPPRGSAPRSPRPRPHWPGSSGPPTGPWPRGTVRTGSPGS
ncbi:NAD(P)-binding domain-containing protein [Streptomyces glomeratus]|nr:NAD(P)-binding domain-containing protein [Streptomyces glomeratus]